MNRDETFSPLFTDLYELTMMLAYRENHLAAKATFSLYIRGSAELNRGFFVAAGLEDALYGLERMRFLAVGYGLSSESEPVSRRVYPVTLRTFVLPVMSGPCPKERSALPMNR